MLRKRGFIYLCGACFFGVSICLSAHIHTHTASDVAEICLSQKNSQLTEHVNIFRDKDELESSADLSWVSVDGRICQLTMKMHITGSSPAVIYSVGVLIVSGVFGVAWLVVWSWDESRWIKELQDGRKAQGQLEKMRVHQAKADEREEWTGRKKVIPREWFLELGRKQWTASRKRMKMRR